MNAQQDLLVIESAEEKAGTRLPRTPKLTPARIDTDETAESYQLRVENNYRQRQKIASILTARQRRKAIQHEINAIKKDRARIEGRSKVSNAAREAIDLNIKALRILKDNI